LISPRPPAASALDPAPPAPALPEIGKNLRQLAVPLRPLDRSREATELRSAVESSAARLAASLDLAAAEQHHPDWADPGESFDVVCNDLDHLLALAGAPRNDP
jgi:hypothetical protein